MNFIIKPLSPELAETFTEYFGSLEFGHAPHWAGCFCQYYFSDCQFEEWISRDGDQNRSMALENIRNGIMEGFLAFDGDKCIGWCNANDIQKLLRIKDEVKDVVKDMKVGCVICFVIHPEYRGRGVARQLLKQAVEDFRATGFNAVISIPVKNVEVQEKQYRGTYNMYKEQGFTETQQDDETVLMMLKF